MNPFQYLTKKRFMVPGLIHDTGLWLDRFSEVLARWESTLHDVQAAYLLGEHQKIEALCEAGEAIHEEIRICKEMRQKLLDDAKSMGYSARNLKELSQEFDSQWPALWTHRITNLELQLGRIQQLSTSLWIWAFQSKSYVSELLLILSTGRAHTATYAPGESQSHEGGYLINEAA